MKNHIEVTIPLNLNTLSQSLVNSDLSNEGLKNFILGIDAHVADLDFSLDLIRELVLSLGPDAKDFSAITESLNKIQTEFKNEEETQEKDTPPTPRFQSIYSDKYGGQVILDRLNNEIIDDPGTNYPYVFSLGADQFYIDQELAPRFLGIPNPNANVADFRVTIDQHQRCIRYEILEVINSNEQKRRYEPRYSSSYEWYMVRDNLTRDWFKNPKTNLPYAFIDEATAKLYIEKILIQGKQIGQIIDFPSQTVYFSLEPRPQLGYCAVKLNVHPIPEITETEEATVKV